MPLAWSELTSYEQIELVLGNIDGLDDEDREAILDEWSHGDYSASADPEASGFADLQAIAVSRLMTKLGRPQRPKIVRLALDREVPRNQYPDR